MRAGNKGRKARRPHIGGRNKIARPHETGLRWAEAYGLELLSSGDDWRIEMGGTEIRFTYDAECLEPALMAIDFEAIDLPAVCTTADELGLERDDCVVTVCGVDFNFM